MRLSAFLLLPLAFSLFVSCASTKPTRTQFLSTPSLLEKDGDDLRYRDKNLKTSGSSQIYIAPVTLQLDKSPLTSEQTSEVKKHYQDALASAFAEHFTVVKKPSKNALTVRSAITGLDSVNRAANLALSIIAIPIDNGGASTETEILVHKTCVYAESRSVVGGLTGKGTFGEKTLGYISRTQHIKSALTSIADDLAKRITDKSY